MESTKLPESVQALLDPAWHGMEDPPKLVQTHISWVILADRFAYKIKKPVNFGFLDFSTLEKRRLYCEREVAINRRAAEELYLRAAPLVRQGDAIVLGEERDADAAIEWVVVMRRFADEDLLDVRLAEGRLDPRWMDALAERVARLHEAAPRAPEGFGSPEDFAEFLRENIREAQRWKGNGLAPELVDALDRWTEQALAHQKQALAKRKEEGFVRECHGDLHLRNIVLWQGEPVPFDAIEFNDAFRMIDVANDVAFFVMDCDARKRPELGLRFFSRWLEETGDEGSLGVFDLYRFYRATVRGKVALLTAAGLEGEGRRQQIEEARRYFQLAFSYTQPKTPKLFAVAGFSGSGKSTLARLGMAEEGALVLRSDAIRKRIARKQGISQQELYTKPMHEATYQAMFSLADAALRAGFSVILDATFLHPPSRDQLRDLAARAGVPYRIVWLDVPKEELRRRIAARKDDLSDADLAVLEMQLAQHAPPPADEAGVIRWPHADRWPTA